MMGIVSVSLKHRPAGVLCVLACVVALAGCGSSSKSGGASMSTGRAYADVVIDAYGAGLSRPDARHVRLAARCSESGALVAGDANARGFCRALSTQKGHRALEAPNPGEACSMIYGGPAQIRLSGTISGKQVEETFGRSNGCEIARYDALFAGVVPPATGV
jgi:hypothetical protein